MPKGDEDRFTIAMSGFRIRDFEIDFTAEKSKIKKRAERPSFVEGLLGVGQVGLLAANHLVRELDFQKVADVYSSHFSEPFSPGDTPGVVYSEDGTVELNKNEVFYWADNDLFVYKGLYQGDYCGGYYEHANRVMDFCEEFKVKRVFTLGGFGTGEEKEEPKTRAVITAPDQASEVGSYAEVLRGRENRPGVTGLSGLLIGLADKNEMEGLSLLGETHGAFPDAKAAKSVLDTLSGIMDFEVDLTGLDEAAEELERRKEEFKRRMKAVRGRDEREYGDTRYIG